MTTESILSKHFGAWGKDDRAATPQVTTQFRHYADVLDSLPATRLKELLLSAHATNTRLHRRCQQAEHEAAYYQRRYDAIQRPLEQATARVAEYARRLRNLHTDEFQYRWRFCPGCQLWWRFKAWLRRH